MASSVHTIKRGHCGTCVRQPVFCGNKATRRGSGSREPSYCRHIVARTCAGLGNSDEDATRRSIISDKSTASQAFVREAGSGSRIRVLGSTHIYKATAAETGGSFSLWEAVFPPGEGPPPHTHSREDEAFYVLEGDLVFQFDGASGSRRLGPGDFFFAGRGRRHAFRNVGDKPARILILSAPSVGLDKMFGELDEASSRGTPDFARIMAICARYGVTVEPPPNA